jgi:hypothetical protein
VEKQRFLDEVWPGHFVEEGNLARHVSFLRQRLMNHSNGTTFIETVPRRGYRFVDGPHSFGAGSRQPDEPAVSDHDLGYTKFQSGLSFAAKPTVEFALEVKAPVEAVFERFASIEDWPAWAPVYRDVSWDTKTPWAIGGAFTAYLNHPFNLNLRYVVVDYVPRRRVGWLVYGVGPVIERWVFFQPMRRKTLVRTLANHVGPTMETLSAETSETVKQFTMSWYNALRTECERHLPRE